MKINELIKISVNDEQNVFYDHKFEFGNGKPVRYHQKSPFPPESPCIPKDLVKFLVFIQILQFIIAYKVEKKTMMNFTIQLHHVEPFMTLDLPKKIGLSIMIFLTLSLGIIVQKQLISFLKYKKKRPVNQIIYTNLILSNTFIPPTLCFTLAMT